jgi:predicted metalloprotease
MRRIRALVATGVIVGALITTPSLAVAGTGGGSGGGGTNLPTTPKQPKAKPTKALAKLIKVTTADLQAFWADQMPAVYGKKYKPVKAVVPYTSKKPGGRCGDDKVPLGNAFYCSVNGLINYDNEKYYPEMFRDLGPIAVQTSLAHEWGHAIQDRAGIFGKVPSVIAELQADCFAGAWARHVQDGDSKLLEFAPGERDTFAARVLHVRDAVGTSPDDPHAHGSAFDRVNALREGFEQSATRCAQFPDTPPSIVEIPFTDETDFKAGGDLPAEQVIPLLIEDLNAYWGPLTGPVYIPLTADKIVSYDSGGAQDQLPTCDGPLTHDFLVDRVFICVSGQYLAYDAPFLGGVYANFGDFGVATLIADAWSEAVQFMNGLQAETNNSILQSHCFTGAWAGTAFFGQRESAFKKLSPGDLDEVVQAIIVSQRGADTSTGAVIFPLIEAFQLGFYQGLQQCLGGPA